jgi:hypothetical protein
VVVGRQSLTLAMRPREVVVMCANPIRHLRFEWEGACWQAKPPTRIASEGGGRSEGWIVNKNNERIGGIPAYTSLVLVANESRILTEGVG